MYFRAFNFRTSQAVRKYFNNEIFAIYGIGNRSNIRHCCDVLEGSLEVSLVMLSTARLFLIRSRLYAPFIGAGIRVTKGSHTRLSRDGSKNETEVVQQKLRRYPLWW